MNTINFLFDFIQVKDVDVPNCMQCFQKFGVFRRKHHCRACGNVFCKECTPHLMKIESLNESNGSRVCDGCFHKMARVVNSPNDEAAFASPIEQDLLAARNKALENSIITARKFESAQVPKYARSYRYEEVKYCDWSHDFKFKTYLLYVIT